MNYMPQYQQIPQQNNIYGQQRPAYQTSTNSWNNSAIRIRPVSSIEEVRASAIDFDGSVFYFPDLANKRIYTKHINIDGTASLLMYELKEIPVEQPSFVTREEFENTISQLKELLAAAPVSAPPIQTEEPKAAPAPTYKF